MDNSSTRVFRDADGQRWNAVLISHGRTSAYLNPRVHKPILQFTSLDHRAPKRYVGYSIETVGPLAECPEPVLRDLLERSSGR